MSVESKRCNEITVPKCTSGVSTLSQVHLAPQRGCIWSKRAPTLFYIKGTPNLVVQFPSQYEGTHLLKEGVLRGSQVPLRRNSHTLGGFDAINLCKFAHCSKVLKSYNNSANVINHRSAQHIKRGTRWSAQYIQLILIKSPLAVILDVRITFFINKPNDTISYPQPWYSLVIRVRKQLPLWIRLVDDTAISNQKIFNYRVMI